ncbi:MAG: glycosyl hydrolase family 65 protein [Patescibacteria group bacterium]
MNKYGHFSKSGDEFIITRPDTPKPWINYLTNGKYCALISQTGGGYAFIGDSGYNRILSSSPDDMIITDRPGRYIFIRDDETGEYWSLGWQPVRKKMDFFETRHGQGYTKITSELKEIRGESTFFVPLEDTLEIWMCKIKNMSNKRRRISIVVYVEWSLANHGANIAETNFNNLFNDVEFEDNTIFATKNRWERPDFENVPWDKYAFLTMDRRVDGYEMDKEEFLGMYNHLSEPAKLKQFTWKNKPKSHDDGKPSIGALYKQFILQPNVEVKFNVLLGTALKSKQEIKYGLYGTENVKKLVKKYINPSTVKEEFEKLNEYWKNYNSHVEVETPDENFNISVNYWNRYQAWITSRWSLMNSYYTGGSSTFGFRDMSQHLIGVLPHEPEYAKNRLKELLSYQLKSGKTVHNWNAFTRRGVVTDHSDDAQWLVLSVIYYLNETEDFKFLHEIVDYYDQDHGTVFEHVLKAMEYTIGICSERGIPHRMTADWNDAMNSGKQGKGESTMVADQLCFNIIMIKDILTKIGEDKLNEKYLYIYNKIKKILNREFWDGAWYIRATGDDGKPIGSKKNKYNKIDINAQSWSVMSGVAAYKDRGNECLDSVSSKLDTRYGPAMFLPSYKIPSSEIGVISEFVPGTKENGSIFNHPISWAVLAECMLGRGEDAYELWRKTSFMTRGQHPDLYQCEPYVYSEFVYGPEHPDFGHGSFSWATGSASWFYRVCIDYICGVRATINGLEIDPCIPDKWKELSVKRDFRGITYDIKIHNHKRVNTGVERILVNGEEYNSCTLPLNITGTCEVEVFMGKSILNKGINFYR